MPVVLYGLVRARHRLPNPPPKGLGHPAGSVRLVRHGPLAAAVSVTAEVGDIGEAEAVIHLGVLQQLLSGGPVLPLRLGSVAPDENAVRDEVLEPVMDDLSAQLDRLADVVELLVDVDEDEQSTLAAIIPGTSLADSPPPDDLDGRIQLGQHIANLVIERRTSQAEQILSRLRPIAEDDAPRRHHGGAEDPTLSWAFLVRSDAAPEFDEAVGKLRMENPHLSIEYVGPLPAVHFVDVPARAAAETTETDDHFTGTGRWGWDTDSGYPKEVPEYE